MESQGEGEKKKNGSPPHPNPSPRSLWKSCSETLVGFWQIQCRQPSQVKQCTKVRREGGKEGKRSRGLQSPFPRAQAQVQLTSVRTTLFLLQQRPPRQGHRHTPQAVDRQKEEGGRGCQKNPEGRKLDRQTEADPGFTAPGRHPPDSQTLRDIPLLSPQEGEGETGLPCFLKPNSSSPGVVLPQPGKRPKTHFSSSHSSPKAHLDQSRGHLLLAEQGHLQGTVAAPPPAKPTALRILGKEGSSSLGAPAAQRQCLGAEGDPSSLQPQPTSFWKLPSAKRGVLGCWDPGGC